MAKRIEAVDKYVPCASPVHHKYKLHLQRVSPFQLGLDWIGAVGFDLSLWL
jgi:hypothetical protein